MAAYLCFMAVLKTVEIVSVILCRASWICSIVDYDSIDLFQRYAWSGIFIHIQKLHIKRRRSSKRFVSRFHQSVLLYCTQNPVSSCRKNQCCHDCPAPQGCPGKSPPLSSFFLHIPSFSIPLFLIHSNHTLYVKKAEESLHCAATPLPYSHRQNLRNPIMLYFLPYSSML